MAIFIDFLVHTAFCMFLSHQKMNFAKLELSDTYVVRSDRQHCKQEGSEEHLE